MTIAGRVLLRASPRNAQGSRVVLYSIPNEGSTPYVTWLEDSKGNTYLGHYFRHMTIAFDDFYMRARDLR
jgi:hypothetical protein